MFSSENYMLVDAMEGFSLSWRSAIFMREVAT
jgi:hypothetical protein